jgi:hypothetical protein
MAEYEAAQSGAGPAPRKGIVPGTWQWLCVKYFAECADYKRLDPRTRNVCRQILEHTYDERIRPDSDRWFRCPRWTPAQLK